ncbi:unnamed protein product [Mytilus coruscus]|uniref:CCHC-type domain-containing protein n=1 Tax=Mytilus coruscus TaxID=42192 RepID=A0A6J8AJT7_MYTCO|nr:unnamed protein product [Mytilus coruscus]
MPTYGRIEEFKFENNFEEYTERLEEYFLANEIDDDDKKRSIFLTVCGEKTYSLLRNLCAPAKPNTKTSDNLIEILTDHLRPKPLIIAERYKFHQRKQESHEKVRDYLANLRKLADTCQFNAFLEEALRDRLNSRCHKCKEIGHISRKCRKSFPKTKIKTKLRSNIKKNTKFKAKPSKVHQIEENSESEPEENSGWEVFTVKTCRTSDNKELKLDVKIGDIDYVMELDTGSRDPITVIGELTVNVVYDKQTEILPLIVVKEGPSLFGRNWLSKLTVDWKHIRSVITPSSVKDKVNKLMQMDVFKDELGTVKGMQASLKLKEEAVPKFFKLRPIPYALRDKVADEIKRLEKRGILEKIKFSEWGAPIVSVMKPDGSVRICGDYKVTINSCLEAYQQLLLCENSRNLVTINTHLGLYRYTRLPFGAASSPAIFQEFMDKVLEGLDGVGCILDDLIITGKKVEYFAFIVNKDGIQPSPKKVEAMLKVPEPENVKELQSWLGKLLSSTKVLAHYDPNVNVELAVDASPYGLGCVISHKYENGEERPIAYASRTLTSAERNYSQIEREALAIIFGVTRFHQYLYGRKFTLITDNKPLSLLLGPKTGIPMLAASRIQRWAIQLSGYQYDVKCKSSSENANADGLSRLPLKETRCESPFNIFWEEVEIRNVQALNELPASANNIKRETEKDSTLVKVKHATLYGWPKYTDISNELKPYFRVKDELSMEEGCLLRGIRVIIPERYRSDVLNELHVNHPGIVRMKGLARMHVWWPNLDTDIEITVRNCTACQNTQSGHHLLLPLIHGYGRYENSKNESGTLSEKLCRFLLGYRTTPHSTTKRTPAELFVGRRLRTRLDTLKPNINERMQRQRSKTKPCRDIANGEPVLVRDYRDNNKWKQGVIVHKLGPVTYQVQVGDLVWKRHIDQIREFVPQENKDIPNILENTKSDIDTELIIVPTCNSNRDTENSENNNESERTKITEKKKTVENANDTIITRRSERVPGTDHPPVVVMQVARESAGFSPVKRLKIESIDEPIASISFPLCSSTPLKPLIPLEPVSTDDEIQIKKPIGVRYNAVFIVDLNELDQKSIYADDNGVWNTASPRSYYRVDIRDGRIENVVPGTLLFSTYTETVKRRYSHESTWKCKDSQSRPFFKTDLSVLDNIKEETRETKPRQLFKKLVDDAGGPLYSSSASSEPRNLQQIYNIRSSTKAATKTDQLTHLVAQIRESTFVHELAADGESLQYVLASEKQLMDLDTFCTHQLHSSVFRLTLPSISETTMLPIHALKI